MNPAMQRNALIAELKDILAATPAHLIWRPVADERGEVLAQGAGEQLAVTEATLPFVDFKGKRVLDLGCNFGFYSFLAARRGAREVVGLEHDPSIARGASILAELNDLNGIKFLAASSKDFHPGEPFDLVLLIDVLGGGKLLRGNVEETLRDALRFTETEAVVSFRPRVHGPTHLDCAVEDLLALYPWRYFKDGVFDLAAYLADSAPGWRMERLPPDPSTDAANKASYRLLKKTC